MKRVHVQLWAVIAGVSACGAPVDGSSVSEPGAEVEEEVGSTYRIAVVQLSQTSNVSLTAASFGTFQADIARISHGKTNIVMDFFGPYHVTPAQVGCNGDFNHDGPLLQTKALSMVGGNTLGPYRHIWFSNEYDLQPACFIGGASGGNFGAGPGYGVGMWTGYVTQRASNELAVHEFLHGINGPGLNWHMKVASCTSGALRSDNAGCQFTEISPGGAPQSGWAMGAGTGQASAPLFDENPIYKSFWNQFGWLPPANTGNVPATVGTYSRTLYPDDGATIPPSGNWLTVVLPLPNFAAWQYRDLFFEYRQHAQIGNNLEDRPGIYVYYEEQQPNSWLGGTQPYMFPTATLLKIGSNPANYNGLQPVPVSPTIAYPIPGEPNISVRVPAACGATCQVDVIVSGPVL